MKLYLAALACLVLLGACSRATDTVVPSDMSTWDKELAPVVQKLGDDDKKAFVEYIARMKMAEVFANGKSAIPFGTTVGQAITEQKKWMAENEKRLAQEKADREKRDV